MSLTATIPSVLSNASDSVTERALVSIVIPALNEGAQIANAVNALGWADEVIVVDGGSSDETVAAAENAGARVISVSGQTIASQRNAGIDAARNTWILALDADERITPALQHEITAIVNGNEPAHAAYRMKFRNHYLGRELRHGPWGRDWHVRLFTRDRRYTCCRVHEHLETINDVGTLTGTILHYPYRDLSHHVAKVVRYATWGAEDLQTRGRTARGWELVTHPAWRFVRDYILFSGWRDGVPGLVATTVSAFASFLKYALLFARTRTTES